METATAAEPVARREITREVRAEQCFEPRIQPDGQVALANCPFHQLAQEHNDLICGMNPCLVRAAVDEVGGTGLDARLAPEDGDCCGKLPPSRAAGVERKSGGEGKVRSERVDSAGRRMRTNKRKQK